MRRIACLIALAALAPARSAAAPIPLRVERILGHLAGGKPLVVAAEQAMVKFSSETSLSQRDAALAGIGARRNQEVAGLPWTLVDLRPGSHVADGIELLRRLPGVENAQPNHVYHPALVPNDARYASQSSLGQIDAPAAWEFGVGNGAKVTVAVVDTGIEGTHPDLVGKLDTVTGLVSQDCSCGACVNDSPPTAVSNHGTLVAGIAAASTNNGTGIAGLSWGAQLLSAKVFDGACAGGTDAALAAAVAYARAQQDTANAGKVVINMSLGAEGLGACPGICPGVDCFQASKDAIAAAVAAGLPVIVAAGNGNGAPVDIPANCPGAFPVGSVNSLNQISAFSNRGAELASGGVVAPGEGILSTDLGASYGSDSGTSFAAPMVAGLAALMLSAKNTLTPAGIQANIRGGADNIGAAAAAQGAGRINAFRAMRLTVKGTLGGYDGDQEAIAFPNPFRASQTGAVNFSIPVSLQGASATIKLYTASGELVREIAGLTWDGKNTAGSPVVSGTYIFVVSTDKGTTRGRVAVIR